MNIPNSALLARDIAAAARDYGTVITHKLLSGDATFAALKDAVEEISRSAPVDHDIVIQAFNILVTEVGFLQPHTLFLRGFDQSGHRTVVVAHYSQMIAHVVYVPKRGLERIITGFYVEKKPMDGASA